MCPLGAASRCSRLCSLGPRPMARVPAPGRGPRAPGPRAPGRRGPDPSLRPWGERKREGEGRREGGRERGREREREKERGRGRQPAHDLMRCGIITGWYDNKCTSHHPQPQPRGPGPGPRARAQGPRARGPGQRPGARGLGPAQGRGSRISAPGSRAPASDLARPLPQPLLPPLPCPKVLRALQGMLD